MDRICLKLNICCSLTCQRVTHELVKPAPELVIGGSLRCHTSSLPRYLLLINMLFVTFVCLYYEGQNGFKYLEYIKVCP